MATLTQILARKWPGSGDGRIAYGTLPGGDDDYTKLVWQGTDPKPSEAEIRAFSAEVDQLLYDDTLDDIMLGMGASPGQLLRILDQMAEFSLELYRVLPSASKTAVDPTKLDKMQRAAKRVQDMRRDAKALLDADLAAGRRRL